MNEYEDIFWALSNTINESMPLSHPLPKPLRSLKPWIDNIWGFCMVYLHPYPLDRFAYEWIVCTSEYECLDISWKLWEVLTEL